MKIKYYIYILAFLMFSACDDFLDPDSLSTFDSEYIFSNTDDARTAVNSIYENFSHDGFRSRLSNNMTGCTDIEHAGGTSSGARYQIWRLDAETNNGDLEYVWDIAYECIRNANICIEGLQASEIFESEDESIYNEMHHLLGESYTLRAYWYSMLIYYFGDVPFVDQAPVAGMDFSLPRTDRNEILSTIIHDLIEIEDEMKWGDECDYGIEQVNREYTIGMISRLCLQRGGYYLTEDLEMLREDDYKAYYDTANTYAAKLISLKDRDLTTDFEEVFMNECKFISPTNEDILFEVPFAVGEGDVGWNIGIKVEGGSEASHSYGAGSNYMAIPPTYYYSFDTCDNRLDVTCALYYYDEDLIQQLVSTSSRINISQGKWCRAWLDDPPGASSAKGTGINWPMMRYPDVLLMRAEAENEINGPTSTAIEMLRRVRQRAFDEEYWTEKVEDYLTEVSASKEAFFNAIVDERGWEFGGEMTRKYDLIRWNLYYDKISQMVTDLTEMADKANDGTGTLPDYLYVKLNESNELQIYNKFEKVTAAPDDTWERESWLIDMYDSDTGVLMSWIDENDDESHWYNYIHGSNIGATDGIVRYIFPIPQEAIDNSKGALSNDDMYGF